MKLQCPHCQQPIELGLVVGVPHARGYPHASPPPVTEPPPAPVRALTAATPLRDLISAKAAGALARAGYTKLGDVAGKYGYDLWRHRGVSVNAVQSLDYALAHASPPLARLLDAAACTQRPPSP